MTVLAHQMLDAVARPRPSDPCSGSPGLTT
ncbi:hypothetical protein MICRO8M_90136 [Microbacterium sp. 8M]|nr:hypothetical protein MICRO8M_90136 [Microbacterium sp. 8M]